MPGRASLQADSGLEFVPLADPDFQALIKSEQSNKSGTSKRPSSKSFTFGGMTIGRATYEPGWKWSEHVGPSLGENRAATWGMSAWSFRASNAAMEGGTVIEMKPGDIFFVPAGCAYPKKSVLIETIEVKQQPQVSSDHVHRLAVSDFLGSAFVPDSWCTAGRDHSSAASPSQTWRNLF